MVYGINFVFSLAVLTLSGSEHTKWEPSCSKYHFEEMVLEKVIRMELSTGRMMEEFVALAAELKPDINHMKQEFEKVKNDIDNTRNAVLSDLENYENKISKLEGKLNQPVYAFSATTLTNTSPKAGERFIFTDVLLNDADVYDASTGKFTAPVNGTFAFTSSMCTYTNKAFSFRIMADGKVISREYNKEHTDASSISAYAVAVLSKGDQVWVEADYAPSSPSLYWTSGGLYCWNRFSGHILSPL